MKIPKINIPILFLIRRHGLLCLLVVISTLISTVLEIISFGTIVPLFNITLNKESLSMPSGGFISKLYEMMRYLPQENLLISLLGFLAIITVVKVGFRMGCEAAKRILDLRIQMDCQKLMYQKVIRSDLSFFISQKTGGLIFRILQLPQEVSSYFQKIPVFFIEIVNIVLLSIFLFSVAPGLFCAMAGLGIIYSLVIHYLSRDLFMKLGEEFPKATAASNIVANEAIGGIREIIIHGQQEH
jgi:ABC-type multidrug transport system fused ATPase/permease subunit